jgi:2-methylcitrate dehydratase PrpD
MQAHTEGSPVLALQIGFAARNALIACDLAEHGFPGLKGVLEGSFGFYGLYEKAGDVRAVLPTLGKVWRITEVAHKPFPSGRATHGIVDAIQELQREHDILTADIERVEARVPSLINHLVGRPVHDKMEVNYARLNGQYAAAVMLRHRFVGLGDFTTKAIRTPETIALARKVNISVNNNPDPNALSPVEVDIHMIGGGVHAKRIGTVYGNPAKPMTRDAHLTKFRGNWAAAACGLKEVDAEKMIIRVDTLETVLDIRELIDLATG